jgi:hypothetical protein
MYIYLFIYYLKIPLKLSDRLDTKMDASESGDSSVSVNSRLTGWLRNEGSFLCRKSVILLFDGVHTGCGANPTSYSKGTGRLLHGDKEAGAGS